MIARQLKSSTARTPTKRPIVLPQRNWGRKQAFLWRKVARRLALLVATAEAVYAAFGINKLLLTREERMTGRANRDLGIRARGAHLVSRLTPGTGDRRLVQFWMNISFHLKTPRSMD